MVSTEQVKSLPLADINECLEQTGLCGPLGTCLNTHGSFRCMCPRGYQVDPSGTMCIDSDDCLDGSCDVGCEVICF